MRLTVTILLASLAFLPSAHALSAADDAMLDTAHLAQLELRAEHAGARERCYLYTELVHVYTEMAGKQIVAGDLENAGVTLKHVQHYAEMIHTGLARDTKRVKDAEMLMHSSTYRLGEYLHLLSSEDSEMVAATKKQLEQVHEELLAQVFAH